jgi:cytochrome bd-type quinol oxidase subunit 1
VGAVSGTVLSFELGLLWPEFMGRFGEAIGLAFSLEGVAFFTEALFLGVYLYGRSASARTCTCLFVIAFVVLRSLDLERRASSSG